MTNSPSLELDATGRTVLTQLQHLRDQGDAPMVLLPDGIHAHAVVRGDIARMLLKDPRVSRNAQKNWPYYRENDGDIPGWMVPWAGVVSMLTTDGADHRRLRNLLSKAFTPRSITDLAPSIEAIVDDLIANLANHPPGATIDIRRDFAYRIPSRVICDLFGVPEEQRPTMLGHIDRVLDTAQTHEQAEANFRGLYAAMHALIETKRITPGDDLTSNLLQVMEDDGDHLSEYELNSTLMLMIGAGTETTVTLIGRIIMRLMRNLALIDTVRTGDRWDDVIEETLRGDPPITFLPMRYATADIELPDGTVIAQGAAMLIGFGGHGRDPQVHQDPERWDIDRENQEHLAFGHGIHYCIGAPLAKLEARIALSKLFDTFPTMRPAVPPEKEEPVTSFISCDTQKLRVRLTA